MSVIFFENFVNKYRIPLLVCLLKDRDFNFNLYYDNNELFIDKFWEAPVYKQKNENKPLPVPEELLFECKIKRSFSPIISGGYYLTERELDIIGLKESHFTNISRLSTILWSDKILDKYKEKWNWSNLSANHSIVWTEERIEKFEELVDFSYLSYNSNLNVSIHFINKYKNRWDWNALSGNPFLAKKFGENWKNNENVVWKNEKTDSQFEWKVEDVNLVYEYNSFRIHRAYEFKPSISSNPCYQWTINDFERNKDKIDFWVLAFCGNLTNQIISKYGSDLNENRLHHTEFKRHSDWYDNHPVYRNGWENLLLNKKNKINAELLKVLDREEADIIFFDGNARDGFKQKQKRIKVKDLGVNPDCLDISFREFCIYDDLIPSDLLNKNKINTTLWNKILKPELLSNRELVEMTIKAI